MENQHKKIKGYRDLTQEEIDTMNMVKERGQDLELLIAAMKKTKSFDQKWVEEAELALQKGIMFAVRAVAKPNSF